tara:strand:+ start:533 stop:901 length:369 start_codon:yes stop_codon:yes gene_type:complete
LHLFYKRYILKSRKDAVLLLVFAEFILMKTRGKSGHCRRGFQITSGGTFQVLGKVQQKITANFKLVRVKRWGKSLPLRAVMSAGQCKPNLVQDQKRVKGLVLRQAAIMVGRSILLATVKLDE